MIPQNPTTTHRTEVSSTKAHVSRSLILRPLPILLAGAALLACEQGTQSHAFKSNIPTAAPGGVGWEGVIEAPPLVEAMPGGVGWEGVIEAPPLVDAMPGGVGWSLSDATSAAAVAPTVSAHHRRDPVVTHLAEFGSDDFVTGSTIGPDGSLYVTDGVAGAVLRVDRRSGLVTPYADGLPPKAFPGGDIGGPVDVAFVGRTAYVLVTLVSGKLGEEPFGDRAAKNGLYRVERDGSITLVTDLGQWSVDNPPEQAFFVDTGVQFALEPYRGGFLVTDGHHNRVLWVDRYGSVHELATFGNVVPTGLETTAGQVFITQLGPIPHRPEDGKVVALRAGSEPREVASGASMLIDVERGPHGRLYGLSMGQWDGVGEGSRAKPDTGRLVVVGRDGELTAVVDGNGEEIVLDRPTSMEFVGTTAYIVSVTGDVYRVDGL